MSTYHCSPRAHWVRDPFAPGRQECVVGDFHEPTCIICYKVPCSCAGTNQFPVPEFSLTAADVERIAKRAAELVIELLKAELTKRDDRRTGG